MRTPATDGRRPWFVVLVAAALAPWSWFLVRDRGAALDAVATGLPVVVVGAVFAGLALTVYIRRAAPAVFAVSMLAMGLVAIVGPWMPHPAPPPARSLRIVSANALDGNESPRAAADIRAQNADVVVVVEGAALVEKALRRRYPFVGFDTTTEHLFTSRFPIRRLPLPARMGSSPDDQVSRWEVRPPSGPFVVYVAHLNHPAVRKVTGIRPSLRRQRDEIRSLLAAVADERLPTLLVGDLNTSDRTWGYRRLSSEQSDAMRSGWAGPTYVRIRYRPFLLRIDHIFIPRDWCSDAGARFRITGSDHRGVSATVGPCR